MSWKMPMLTGLGVLMLCVSLGSLSGGSGWLNENPLTPLIANATEARRLENLDQHILERIETKTKLIDQVLAGRMSLLEAAAWFRHLAQSGLDEPMRTLDYLPGRTDEEKFCLQVISWTISQARDVHLSQAEEVLARLQCELEAARRTGDGKIILPDR